MFPGCFSRTSLSLKKERKEHIIKSKCMSVYTYSPFKDFANFLKIFVKFIVQNPHMYSLL